MFVNKKFVNKELITKITKTLCHENLELYGICLNHRYYLYAQTYMRKDTTIKACVAT